MRALISNSENFNLVEKIAKKNQMLYIEAKILKYSGGEIQLYFDSNNLDEIYIFQNLWPEPNCKIIELLSILDICQDCKNINLILPFIPYLRQDKDEKLISSGSRIIAKLINQYNIQKIITFEPHSLNSLKYFNTKIDILNIYDSFFEVINNNTDQNSIIISPDKGGIERAKKLSELTKIRYTYFEKTRYQNKITMSCKDDLKQFNNIYIIDDMSDTCRTLNECIKLLNINNNINILLTHVLDEEKIISLAKNNNIKLYYSNTISNNKKYNINIGNIISNTKFHS